MILEEAKATLAKLEELQREQERIQTQANEAIEASQEQLGERLLRVAMDGGDVEAERQAIESEVAAQERKLSAAKALWQALDGRIEQAEHDLLLAKADALEEVANQLEVDLAQQERELGDLCQLLTAHEGERSFWIMPEIAATPKARARLARMRTAIGAMRAGHQAPIDATTGRPFDAVLK